MPVVIRIIHTSFAVKVSWFFSNHRLLRQKIQKVYMGRQQAQPLDPLKF